MVFVTQFFSLFAAPETILLDGDPCVAAYCVPHIAEGLVVLQKLADSVPSASLSFRGEGATVKLAEDDGNLLKVFVANKQTAGFNPFD